MSALCKSVFLIIITILAADALAQNTTASTVSPSTEGSGTSWFKLGPLTQTHEPSIATVQDQYSSASDGVSLNAMQVDYHSHRRDLFWPYPDERKRGLDLEVNAQSESGRTIYGEYSGSRLVGTLGMKTSDNLYVDVAGGVHNLRNGWENNNSSLPYFQLHSQYHPIGELNLELLANQDYVFRNWLENNNVTEKIYGKNIFLNGEWRATDRIRILYHGTETWVNDGNRLDSHELIAFYGILTGNASVWGGLDLSYLNFINPVGDYWSPQGLIQGGPKVEFNVPIVGDLSGGGTVQTYWNQDIHNTISAGFFTQLNLGYGLRDKLHVDASVVPMGNFPSYGNWNRQDYTLSVTGSF